MINLLPPAAKRMVRREYWLRVGVVVCGILSGVLLIGAAFSIPSFVLVSAQLNGFEQQLQAASAAVEEQAALRETVEDTNLSAKKAYRIGSATSIMPLVDEIFAAQNSGISITSIQTQRVETAIPSITVGGTAATRDSLTAFSDALVARAVFTEADVPLSSLAEQRDLSFSLTITIAEDLPQ